MAKIVILGSGVMGSAIALPAERNHNEVVLIGSPLDDDLIDAMRGAGKAHPRLGVPMPESVLLVKEAEVSKAHFRHTDLVLLGVSSPGLPWVLNFLSRHLQARPILMMVTKGLDAGRGGATRTLPPMIDETLMSRLGFSLPIVGVGGPCIAKEVAEGQVTATVFGGGDTQALDACKLAFQGPDYQVRLTQDLVGLEACAAIKNFMAIGVAANWTANPPRNPTTAKPRDMNPAAGCFQQAVTEMAMLCEWLGGSRETAYGLAGMGDLFVTVNAGRNSRLGLELGLGLTVSKAMEGPLAGETIEGVDTGRNLGPGLKAAFSGGQLEEAAFPLTCALLTSILDDARFNSPVHAFWHLQALA